MRAALQPIFYALFLWWFSTGAIIWLDGLPRSTFRWSVLAATIVLAGAMFGIHQTADSVTVTAAYQAFSCGLLAWGWHEITFYMGWVTGPRKVRCPEGCSGWRHLGHAIAASLWHELAIIASAAVILAMTWEQANHAALWTFLVLWGMHQSAKLNVLLGVRNLNEQFLPEHLDFLRGFLKQKPMNLLFPLSITVSTTVLVMLSVDTAALPAGGFAWTSRLFIVSLLGLAILEHWFLVLPLPAAALWNWSLHARETPAAFQVDLVAGFLGAGKTTVMRRLLADARPGERTLVLANDFSDLGIDGSLLAGRGADVIELSNGCICCSLQKDLGRQLLQLARTHRPERVLIEPSGVADVAAVLAALGKPAVKSLIAELRVLTLVDAAAFLGDFARMPAYFEAQARVSPVVLVNKTDLVHEGSLEIIRHTLLGIHPGVRIVHSRYGLPVDGSSLDTLLASARQASNGQAGAGASQSRPVAQEWLPVTAQRDPAPRAPNGSREGDSALGFQSWSATLSGVCDADRLRGLLDALAAGRYGRLERVKGIVRAEGGWVRFDLAGGRPAIAAHAVQGDELPRVMAIGHDVDGPSLLQAFLDCTLPGALQHG
jgi:putative photosynthetic complex assembly protein 2